MKNNSMDKLIKQFSLLVISNKLMQQKDSNIEIEIEGIKRKESNMKDKATSNYQKAKRRQKILIQKK